MEGCISACPPAQPSVDAILSSQNIEHLYPHEVALALKEFLRVLRPDGFAVIQHRSVPKQIEYESRIGKVAEENPDLTYSMIRVILMSDKDNFWLRCQPFNRPDGWSWLLFGLQQVLLCLSSNCPFLWQSPSGSLSSMRAMTS